MKYNGDTVVNLIFLKEEAAFQVFEELRPLADTADSAPSLQQLYLDPEGYRALADI